MNKKKTLLEAKNLCKSFGHGAGKINAVDNVSLEIEKGEKVYIYGPSGAGKSTLLDILGSLRGPSGGSVEYMGKSIYDMSDRKRSVLRNISFGFVFQFYHLMPELTVWENVTFPARLLNILNRKNVEERAMSLLERVGMKSRIKARPYMLSGGEAQRVSLARALINAPALLFCDEPTGNLDSEMTKNIYNLLTELGLQEKMSMVIVSHQEVPQRLYDKKYYMKDGVLNAV